MTLPYPSMTQVQLQAAFQAWQAKRAAALVSRSSLVAKTPKSRIGQGTAALTPAQRRKRARALRNWNRAVERGRVPGPGTLEIGSGGELSAGSVKDPSTRIQFRKGVDSLSIPYECDSYLENMEGVTAVPAFSLLTGYDPDKLLDSSGHLVSKKCRCKNQVSFILKKEDDSEEFNYQLRCKRCMGIIKSRCDSNGEPLKRSGK